MDEMTLVISMGAIVGHGVADFHPGLGPGRDSMSIGDQQAAMALQACRTAPERPQGVRSELICLHCGAEMRLIEDLRLGNSLHLSAECPRCPSLRSGCLAKACLHASSIELEPPQRFLELPQEASFD